MCCTPNVSLQTTNTIANLAKTRHAKISVICIRAWRGYRNHFSRCHAGISVPDFWQDRKTSKSTCKRISRGEYGTIQRAVNQVAVVVLERLKLKWRTSWILVRSGWSWTWSKSKTNIQAWKHSTKPTNCLFSIFHDFNRTKCHISVSQARTLLYWSFRLVTPPTGTIHFNIQQTA